MLNKLRNNLKFCAKFQISYNYLHINAKTIYRKLKFIGILKLDILLEKLTRFDFDISSPGSVVGSRRNF